MLRSVESVTQPATIRLRVSLQADMRKFLPKGVIGPQAVELPGGATIALLLQRLGVPADEIVTVGLNGELAGRDSVLQENDDITMFSPMEGG